MKTKKKGTEKMKSNIDSAFCVHSQKKTKTKTKTKT